MCEQDFVSDGWQTSHRLEVYVRLGMCIDCRHTVVSICWSHE